MTLKKRMSKSIALALIGITLTTPMLNSASAMEIPSTKIIALNQGNNKNIINVDKKINYTNLMEDQLNNDLNIVNKNQRGVASISAKLAKKALLKYKTKIITLLKKLPYGSKLASMFTKHFNSLCSFLDKVKDGAEKAIYRFFRNLGFSHFWADLIADAIMTILGILL